MKLFQIFQDNFLIVIKVIGVFLLCIFLNSQNVKRSLLRHPIISPPILQLRNEENLIQATKDKNIKESNIKLIEKPINDIQISPINKYLKQNTIVTNQEKIEHFPEPPAPILFPKEYNLTKEPVITDLSINNYPSEMTLNNIQPPPIYSKYTNEYNNPITSKIRKFVQKYVPTDSFSYQNNLKFSRKMSISKSRSRSVNRQYLVRKNKHSNTLLDNLYEINENPSPVFPPIILVFF